jgi:pyruvate kinase
MATLGPSSDVLELAREGARAFRLNLSYNDIEWHTSMIERVRESEDKLGLPLGVVADLRGRKLRISSTEYDVVEGQTVVLESDTHSPSYGIHTSQRLTIDADIFEQLEEGAQLILGDGDVVLKVEKLSDTQASARVVSGGRIKDNMGLRVVGVSLELPPITKLDREYVRKLSKLVDYFGLSFVSSSRDMEELRKLSHVPIIAKIERREAVENLREIVECCDGVMVARGDLGVELSLEKVPLIQKEVLRLSRALGKPGIVATQMLESMLHSPSPTRAEVADVANAILDGADTLMLSGETAVGKYPREAVRWMKKIISETERFGKFEPIQEIEKSTVSSAISKAVYVLASELNAGAIFTPTATGTTPRLVARFRPSQWIYALSYSQRTARRLSIVWGVIPLREEFREDLDALTNKVIELAGERKGVVVLTAGLGAPGTTNLIKVVSLDSPTTQPTDFPDFIRE